MLRSQLSPNKSLVCAVVSFFAFCLLAAGVFFGRLHEGNLFVAQHIRSLANPALTSITLFITNLADWPGYVAFGVFLLVFPATRSSIGVPAILTLLISALINHLLKQCFAIERPEIWIIAETGYSFPSGHAMNATAFFGACAWLFIRRFKRARTCILATTALFILYVGFSRIYLGVHTLADVLAGYAAGVFVLCCAILFMKQTQPTAKQAYFSVDKHTSGKV